MHHLPQTICRRNTTNRTKKENNIADHFNLENHSPTSYTIKIVGQEEDKNKRLCLEEAWIHILDTIQPRGLNLNL